VGNAGPQAPPGRMEGRTSDGGTAFVPEYGAFGASCLTAEPGAGTIVLLQPGSAGACFVHLRQSRLLDMFERSSRERNRKNRLGASLKTFSSGRREETWKRLFRLEGSAEPSAAWQKHRSPERDGYRVGRCSAAGEYSAGRLVFYAFFSESKVNKQWKKAAKDSCKADLFGRRFRISS